jgi:uncharacterized protein
MRLTSHRLNWASVTAVFCLQLIACAATPPNRFHSLLTMDSTPRALAVVPGFAVTLSTVSVPLQVDQPQWLVRNADGSLSMLEQERWVAPLRGELQAALLDRWAIGWGGRPVVAGSKESAWRVTVDVMRWDALPGREVRLESRWSATSGASTLSCRSVIREAAAVGNGSLLLALADSHRRAVSRLADEVASRITEVQKGEPALCADVAV